MNKLTELELEQLKEAGIKYVTYTDEGVTKVTVTRLIDNTKGKHLVIRCNYTGFDSIEIVSIQRSKSVRIYHDQAK